MGIKVGTIRASDENEIREREVEDTIRRLKMGRCTGVDMVLQVR